MRIPLLVCAALSLVLGCGEDPDPRLTARDGSLGDSLISFSDSANDAASDRGVTADRGVDVSVDAARLCPDDRQAVGTLGAAVFSGTTADGSDGFRPSCGNSTAPDRVHRFRAPRAGRYRFDTFGSDFDTILEVLNGATCTGTSIGCNDDYQGNASAVIADLVANQEVVVAVDGHMGRSGSYVVNILETNHGPAGMCPDDTTPQSNVGSGVFSGTTALRGDDHVSVCNNSPSADVVHRFRAPTAGRYRFSLSSSSFVGARLEILSSCGGPAVACGSLLVTLALNQEVLIAVEGRDEVSAGAYSIDVLRLAPDLPTPCPDRNGVLVNSAGLTVSLGLASHTGVASIAGGCGTDMPVGFLRFRAPSTGYFQFEGLAAGAPTMLAVSTACGSKDRGCGMPSVATFLSNGEEVGVYVYGDGELAARISLLPLNVTDYVDSIRDTNAIRCACQQSSCAPLQTAEQRVCQEAYLRGPGSQNAVTLACEAPLRVALSNCLAAVTACDAAAIQACESAYVTDRAIACPMLLPLDTDFVVRCLGGQTCNGTAIAGSQPFSGSTEGAISQATSSCGLGQGSSKLIAWSPSETGNYAVALSSQGSAPRWSLELRGSCYGYSLSCAQDVAAPITSYIHARVGQTYFIQVDASTAAPQSFELNFTRL